MGAGLEKFIGSLYRASAQDRYRGIKCESKKDVP